MVYTAYSKEEYDKATPQHKKLVVGIEDCGEILQLPLCPECGSEMMEIESQYLSCIVCGAIRNKRVLKQ